MIEPRQRRVAVGLGIAATSVLLRLGGDNGGLLPGAVGPTSAYTVALFLLAAVAVAATVSASRLDPAAGDHVRLGGRAARG